MHVLIESAFRLLGYADPREAINQLQHDRRGGEGNEEHLGPRLAPSCATETPREIVSAAAAPQRGHCGFVRA